MTPAKVIQLVNQQFIIDEEDEGHRTDNYLVALLPACESAAHQYSKN